MNREQMQDFAECALTRTWAKLRGIRPGLSAIVPALKVNNRLKTTAGRAFFIEHYIDLSAELLAQYPEEFANVIIPHEAAHLAAFAWYKDEGHGKGWKRVMQELGLPPDRLHTLTNSVHVARRSKV